MALGGAGTAGPLLNDAIYLNPSYVSFLPTYALGFNYLFYSGANDLHGVIKNISVQDGRSELFQAGVGYTHSFSERQIHFGASRSIIQGVGLGLGGKFIIPTDDRHEQVRDMTLSGTFVATDWFQAVGVIDNLIQSANAKYYGYYREYRIGTKFNYQGIFLAYFDPQLSPDVPAGQGGKFGHSLGLEFPFMSDFFVRLGEFRETKVPFARVRGRGYGFGVGWIAPKLSLDYGLERMVSPVAATAHSFGMTVFF